MATRILDRAGLLAADGRVAALVGSEVVYLAARGIAPATMTPYDVCALRLSDGGVLAGDPPADADRYLRMLAADRRAVAVTRDGEVGAADVQRLVERLLGGSWHEAVAEARAAGALIGAYPASAG